MDELLRTAGELLRVEPLRVADCTFDERVADCTFDERVAVPALLLLDGVARVVVVTDCERVEVLLTAAFRVEEVRVLALSTRVALARLPAAVIRSFERILALLKVREPVLRFDTRVAPAEALLREEVVWRIVARLSLSMSRAFVTPREAFLVAKERSGWRVA